jgi:deoxyribonuclease V
MDVVTERFRPDKIETDSREAMKAIQTEIADAARFEDGVDFTPDSIRRGETLVAGIDQAFLDERVISAVVVLREETVVARASAVTPQEMPYVPGLLAFREAPPIIEALESLEIEPDLLVFDGSGRIHYREAGIATHMGVCFDAPSIGVAKNLLCGRPTNSTDELAAGETVPIEADSSMSAPDGTIVGYAYQSRQFPDSKRINPLYVSAGHRLSAETAIEQLAACGGAYKLPRPIRLADRYADELKSDID